MQGSDDGSRRPTRWRRLPRLEPAAKDMTGHLGRELRQVFSVATTSSDLEGARRLLNEIEQKRRHRG